MRAEIAKLLVLDSTCRPWLSPSSSNQKENPGSSKGKATLG